MNMLKINYGIHRLDKYNLLLTGGCLTLIFVILIWLFYKKTRSLKHTDPQNNGDMVQRYIGSPLVLKGRSTYSTPKNYGHTSRRIGWGIGSCPPKHTDY